MTYLTRSKLTVLEPAECWSLIRSHQYGVGRIAFNDPPADPGTPPEILPVNYLLDDSAIVVQTGTGLLHDAALHGMPVSFEIDSITAAEYGQRASGWSVVIHGRCELVADAAQQTFLRLSHLTPAGGGFKPSFVRIPVEVMTGRRF